MLTTKLVLISSLVLATTGALADAGDQHINDWATFNSMVTRVQVKAELREATRLGLISFGEGDVPIATAEQERLIAKAGKDAVERFAKTMAGADEG